MFRGGKDFGEGADGTIQKLERVILPEKNAVMRRVEENTTALHERFGAQGVGFRYTAVRLARPLGLTGWVKNLRDGRVEMEVQGESEAIERLLSYLRNQRFIVISDVEIQTIPVVEETGFTERY